MKKEIIFIKIPLFFTCDLKSQEGSPKIPIKSIIFSVKECNSLLHWALNAAPNADLLVF
jgi:hypothetical protein